MTLRPRPPLAGLMLFVPLALLGCGSSGEERPEVYPVAGKLIVKGQPAAGATVMLHPVGDGAGESFHPHGVVDPGGVFTITTFETNDGAPAGEYALTVVWLRDTGRSPDPDPVPVGKDVFGGRYADPDRPIATVSVEAGNNTLKPIELN